MPVIIAATDFTDVAENAVHYACKLALAQNAEIVVLHTYYVPIMFSDIPIPSPVLDTQKEVEESMRKLLGKLRIIYPTLIINSTIIYGNVLDGIEDYTEKNGEPLMVIAGNAYNNEYPVWNDSTLMQALKHLKYPLLAIPAGTSYNPIKKICLAFDNNFQGCDIGLVKLRELVTFFSAKLHVLLAQTDATKPDTGEDIDASAKLLLAGVNPQYHIIHGTHADTAILDYVAQYNIDLLVVIPRKHSFFERLFHKSHTAVMVNDTQIPVMALHEN